MSHTHTQKIDTIIMIQLLGDDDVTLCCSDVVYQHFRETGSHYLEDEDTSQTVCLNYLSLCGQWTKISISVLFQQPAVDISSVCKCEICNLSCQMYKCKRTTQKCAKDK
jgi:hypothetical protein